MDKAYQHSRHEAGIYAAWEKQNAFDPNARKPSDDAAAKPRFTIMMPPPNANDPLHIGHAMFVALEDIMIRFHRMLGEETLWLPGTDHAGIETQFIFEKKLKKDGKSRFQFDRETLYQMIWDYVQENSNTAIDQLKKLGASADWSRYTFMLDPKVVEIVLQTFIEMHEKELIYRDYRLVNFCTKCGTAFSELEVDHIERQDSLYYMKYGPFTIATVRPETKFRDTALAVNPNDPRYQEWLGKTLEIPGLLGPITMTVITDEGVDPEFGTGIMKVTPAHDHHDFELSKKYDLPITPIIDFQGRMDFSWFLEEENIEPRYRERAEKYHHKKVAEARKLMVEDLQADGLLVKVNTEYNHSIGVCYRCGTVIEPLPLPQFFVKVKPLTEKVLTAIDAKEVTILGAGHDKILRHWLENLKDWNISRQIVWGIRMPIWYSVDENPEIQITFLDQDKQRISGSANQLLQKYDFAAIKNQLQELKAPIGAKYTVSINSPGERYIQETDTFDTWFSSAQWPYSTLMAQKPDDFSRFYPTQVMETGYDILPFWVMRMLMMGIFKTGKVPFSTVYLHGLVRDQKGQKMSKSKGNAINPLTIIEQYGADALRMALVIRSSVGLDKSVGDSDFKAMRNFTNKIWNAARFIKEMSPTIEANPTEDEAFEARLQTIVRQITQQLHDYKIGLAAETLYNQFWHWYCDECIETAKKGALSPALLQKGLEAFLKMLHPFMPFVTEAVWGELESAKRSVADGRRANTKQEKQLLITSPWPTA